MAPVRTSTSKILRPGLARISQTLPSASTATASQQRYIVSKDNQRSFSTQQKQSTSWQKPSIGFLEDYTAKYISSKKAISKQQEGTLPSAQQLESRLMKALEEKNAWDIIEQSELAIMYMLKGDIDIAVLEATAQNALQEIENDLLSDYERASTGLLGGSAIGSMLPLLTGEMAAFVPFTISTLAGLGFYATARAIKRAHLGNARAAAQELLKITAKAQEILNEQNNQKNYEDVD